MIKVDSLDQQRRLGALHSRPRWARAFKWAPMTAETKLLEIMIRVGRTGALNPWALMEPVEVGGVTVTRATLHNEEDINRKQIREGDIVIVQRAGDVIPQIVGPAGGVHQPGTKEFRMPKKCPLCGIDVVKPEGEVDASLPEPGVPVARPGDADQLDGHRRHRGRRRAVDPHALGPGPRPLAARSLPADEGAAARAGRLRRDLGDERRSRRSSASKQVPFSRVLLGLNIPGIGWVLAQNLARHFENVDRLIGGDPGGGRAEVEGFGPDRAELVVEWFADDQNRALVQELRDLGLRFEIGEEDRPAEGPLTGSTYVITGTLEAFSREEASAALEAKGAKVTGSVSKKTTGLVVGEEPGASKLTKAQTRGRAPLPRPIWTSSSGR